MALRSWQKKVQFNIRWRKIDSHIDKKLGVDPTRQLKGDPLAWRLNECVDELAGKERKQMKENGAEVFIPQSSIMVAIGGSMVYGSIYDRLTEKIHGPVLVEYMCEKFQWSKEVFHSIHWKAMEMYAKKK